MKAAFDKIDRKKLEEMSKKTGMRDRLKRRIMETYREMKNKVRAGNKTSKEFWTKSGVRIPKSNFIQCIRFGKKNEERTDRRDSKVIRKEKIWTISYVVLLADSEQELKAMIGRFKRYLEKKGLKHRKIKSNDVRKR